MIQWMKAAFLSAVAWVWPSPPLAIDEPTAETAATEPAKAAPPADSDWRFEAKDIEQSGHFYFRTGILEQLENYFVCIRRMRKMDHEAYDLYRKVGAHVLPEATLATVNNLPPRWTIGEIPSFGAVCLVGSHKFEGDRSLDRVHPKFMYFQKLKRSVPGVQQSPGHTLFSFTGFYDDPKDPKLPWGFPITFHCYLGDDHRFHLLKEHEQTSAIISKRMTVHRTGRKSRRELQRDRVPSFKWQYPSLYMSLFKEKFNEHLQPEQTANMLMCLVASYYECAEAATRVTVSHGSLNAVFAIDIKRTPYFFKDRDMVRTESGARKRIFHVVRAHRRIRNNVERYVKFHFRGVREFVWNGYKVLVTVPGLHHIDLATNGPEATVFPDTKNVPGYATMGQLGTMLDEHIHGRTVH